MLLCLILCLLAGCALSFVRIESIERYVCYTLLAEVEEAVAAAFSVGDTLTDAVGKETAGRVIKVSREAALGEDASGVYPLPRRVRLCLEIEARGRAREGALTVGTLTPLCGGRLALHGRARVEGVCIRVRVL